jgi:predicted anti-sigma-YlaC factor YlaD
VRDTPGHGAAGDRRGEELECSTARELISAAVDDELGQLDAGRLRTHLAGCAACGAHADRLATLTRTFRLRAVTVEPDFVDRVMSDSHARLGRGAWLRPALGWCGVLVGAQAVRPLVFAEFAGAPTHVARHIGASALALAIGLLYAAWRPHRAAGLLPFAGALLAATLFGTLLDTLDGDRAALAESVHLAEVAGVLLLWLVAGSPGWERVRPRAIRRGRGVARPTS